MNGPSSASTETPAGLCSSTPKRASIFATSSAAASSSRRFLRDLQRLGVLEPELGDPVEGGGPVAEDVAGPGQDQALQAGDRRRQRGVGLGVVALERLDVVGVGPNGEELVHGGPFFGFPTILTAGAAAGAGSGQPSR